ncbi:MAG: cupin domain-containing protein [Alphaproteobacteria bacterium]
MTLKLFAATAALALYGVAALAQPAADAIRAPEGIREGPSNLSLNLDVGRFVSDPATHPSRILNETIMVRPILTTGDPLKPGNNGAVLRYRKEVLLGTMQPGEVTPLSTMQEQQVIYVESGTARLDDGINVWDLREGITMLIPPNIPYRYTVTGDAELKMLMLSSVVKPEVKTQPGIVVRDVHKMQYVEQGAHWNNLSKGPFTDLGERYLIVYLTPMSVAGAHTHDANTDEAWVKITDGPALLQMGSEVRWWTANVGMMAVPHSQTVHAATNVSDKIQACFYFAGTGPTSPPQPRPPQPGRTPLNPSISQSVLDSTVAARPLNPIVKKK